MDFEFTAEELKDVIRAARVFSPGFSEEQLQGLVELEGRLADSGFLETLQGLLRLEKEKGRPCNQALDAYEELIQRNEELEGGVADRKAELQALEACLKETEETYRQQLEATEHARAELAQVRDERGKEEKRLSAFKRKAMREKQRIDKEVAEHRRKAGVTDEEIVTAMEVKAEVARHGFTLELALGLVQEFAGYEDARQKLAEALEKHGRLTDHLAALEVESEKLERRRHHMEDTLSRLQAEQERQEGVLSQLKDEIAEKAGLVDFYHRYVHLRTLIDYLGQWSQVTFHHCTWCGALFWVLRPGNIPRSASRCPWCGLALVDADRNAYATVAQPVGAQLKLLP